MSINNTTDNAICSRGKVGHVSHSVTDDTAATCTRDHALSWDDNVTHEDERTLGDVEAETSVTPQLYDKETRDWLLKRCVHCAAVSIPGRNKWDNKLGLFSTPAGDVLVHMRCWQAWYDALVEKALEGECQVCGEPTSDGNPLGLYPSGNVAGVAGHVGCFMTWLKQNPKAEILRPTGGDPLQRGRGRLRESNPKT